MAEFKFTSTDSWTMAGVRLPLKQGGSTPRKGDLKALEDNMREADRLYQDSKSRVSGSPVEITGIKASSSHTGGT